MRIHGLKHWFRAFALLCLIQAGGAFAAEPEQLLVISYHDVRDDVATKGDVDSYAISTQNFAAHLDWLSAQGYQPISLTQLIDASEGRAALPDKPVLLTFDDGLRSLYTHVFPLLRAYNFPALAAVITGWVDLPQGQTVDFGPRPYTHEDFVTWAQLREMQDSGLIEIASHTDNLHHGVLSNPQGNQTPAAITRIYDPASARYEDEAAYRARVRADIARSSALIGKNLGRAPRSIVWPYAAYSSVANDIADSEGMRITFDLEGRNARLGGDLHGLARLLMMDNPTVADLAYDLRHDLELDGMRAMQVDLDDVYDADPAQQLRNLDALVERVKQIGPSHVFLQAFADPDGNGSADALYFPNRHLPMRADLFNRVAWQLYTRADVLVYAWLPVLGYEPPDPGLRRRIAIPDAQDHEIFRLDFTRPEARQLIADVYEDLAIASYFEGLLFHDDAFLREGELPALAAGARTQALIDFTLELKRAAEKWRPKLKTVRNLYANTVLDPASEAWFAQRLDSFNRAYDHTALMAMPWMENSDEPRQWMRDLVHAVRGHDPSFAKTIFQLQTVDWRSGKPIPGATLKQQVRELQASGVRHLAWYPDDFIADSPPMEVAREAFSARNFPYIAK
ncbi:biofilm PGA synthesis lipoprotein PgaB [Luteimonas cucumeris]|uniref:Biofilm PGA synthesis lipoprotein PgaB n=1 Tax=Luteimonas cucumeris TaxID=985012 RepID=A0A562L7K0_9GAMM|nr:poly-beta-1,6-N-acetyl-D-glucosamine N-deacetylase PgaB [Luteimonas cucumeris]TWI03598.1 biofilm PGA synthesis lipoprotein PgaB [Luteimonas cucumeris]